MLHITNYAEFELYLPDEHFETIHPPFYARVIPLEAYGLNNHMVGSNQDGL